MNTRVIDLTAMTMEQRSILSLRQQSYHSFRDVSQMKPWERFMTSIGAISEINSTYNNKDRNNGDNDKIVLKYKTVKQNQDLLEFEI